MIERLQRLVESRGFQNFILAVIVLNAVILGLETSQTVMAAMGGVLKALDKIALVVFVIEIGLKLIVYRHRFFTNAWNIFDFVIVGVTLVPAGEGVSVLRALRILRALRLVSMVPSMRLVVQALLRAIPGMGSVIMLLSLVFYIASVMATKLFGGSFPDWFGTIGESVYSLFQIMTWIFFVVFILLTTFAVLNLFIAIIVDSMSQEHKALEGDTEDAYHPNNQDIMAELKALRAEVRALRQ